MKPIKFSPFIKNHEQANGYAMEELAKLLEDDTFNPEAPFMISFEVDGQLYILEARKDHLFLDTAHMISVGVMNEGPFKGMKCMMPVADSEDNDYEEEEDSKKETRP